jgi:putative oxidoreductase
MYVLSRLSFLEQPALMLLRAGSGLFMAFLHGWGKIKGAWGHLVRGEDWGFPDSVSALGFPIPLLFAVLAALSEFIGGLLLAVGLYTRTAALFIAIVMSVAVYRHLTTDMRYELAALFLLVSFFFLVRGAGRLSLDRYLKTERA